MAGKVINVALVGAGFMGKSHSNAYLKVNKFFDLPAKVVMHTMVDVAADAGRVAAVVGAAGADGRQRQPARERRDRHHLPKLCKHGRLCPFVRPASSVRRLPHRQHPGRSLVRRSDI